MATINSVWILGSMTFQNFHHKKQRSTIFRFTKIAGLVSLSSLILVGCSTAPPVSDVFSSSETHFRKNAPYNRPYRVKGKKYYPLTRPEGYKERGIASWYGAESGNRTAMGVRFVPQGLTAAHKTLPLPSKVKVTNLSNGRSVILTVNDRGPFVKNRLIDLSQGAARAIGVKGLAEVEVEYIAEQAMNE
ncbi:MAG: septal ring lytic transglycosylase RlpA family protein [Gammaproteobacteria bacterium]